MGMTMHDPEFSNQRHENLAHAHRSAVPAAALQPSSRRVRLLSSRTGQAGFTLLQVIGAMLVAAILAAILIASFRRQYAVKATVEENADLAVFVDGLQRYIGDAKIIPDHTGWAAAIAQPIGRRVDEVLANRLGNARAFLIDPALRVGTASGVLPYTQTIAGSLIKPISPRLMILSSLSLPLPVTSGVPSANDFNNLWNLAQDTVPSGWPAAWANSGHDLKIIRIDLTPLFVNLTLANFDSPTTPGTYTIDNQGSATVPSNGVNTYLIQGSLVGFIDRLGALESRHPLNRDASFIYERFLWRGIRYERTRIKGLDVEKMEFFFTAFPNNANARFDTTQALVVAAMQEYFDAYAAWSAEGYDTVGRPATHLRVLAASTDLANLTNDLLFKPTL